MRASQASSAAKIAAMAASTSTRVVFLAERDERVHPVHEGPHVTGLGLHERLAVGRAQLHDHDGVTGVVEAGPDVHVAVTGGLVETLAEQLAAERPAHVAARRS